MTAMVVAWTRPDDASALAFAAAFAAAAGLVLWIALALRLLAWIRASTPRRR